MKHFLAVLLMASVALLTGCSAESGAAKAHARVELRDGSTLAGTITEQNASQLKLKGDDGTEHTVPMAQVKVLEYDEAPVVADAKADAKDAEPGKAATPAKARPHEAHPHPDATAVQSKTLRLPAGTQLQVRAEETIDSATAAEGQTFAADFTDNVRDANGDVVIPDGANAQIVIRSASKGGRFKGASDLVLDLDSVSIGGRRYQLDTSDMMRKGRDGVGANKRTAVFTGTGAVVGAVIGAIAGGGKGAAIGAASGAGAGAVAQVVTKGGSIKVPVETLLTFQLDKELRVAQR